MLLWSDTRILRSVALPKQILEFAFFGALASEAYPARFKSCQPLTGRTCSEEKITGFLHIHTYKIPSSVQLQSLRTCIYIYIISISNIQRFACHTCWPRHTHSIHQTGREITWNHIPWKESITNSSGKIAVATRRIFFTNTNLRTAGGRFCWCMFSSQRVGGVNVICSNIHTISSQKVV